MNYDQCLLRRFDELRIRHVPWYKQYESTCSLSHQTIMYFLNLYGTKSYFVYYVYGESYLAADYTWIEVTRVPFRAEGTTTVFYFTISPGSGIWINVKRSLRQHSDKDLTPSSHSYNISSGCSQSNPCKERFNIALAHIDGFDTVQYSLDDGVEVHPQVAIVGTTAFRPRCSFLNHIDQLDICLRGDPSLCVKGLDMRAGVAHTPCSCLEIANFLNCGSRWLTRLTTL